ncbi:N-acetylneuraminate synthase [Hoeflea sp. WL0058]|uniref:N-acetylneuraminate synthase n=1 Tax=Flavimaribacter sediminis TaxID=2865987 RepID=A0AAE2ZL01_9HYPH|nr:N-acetylneuraminate synthase [Flavimaribacter sediminis]MBW8636208.1 N-acetylneuraminate synthase [Flavimaribacter sediminis]
MTQKTIIIAEAGVNHNGDTGLAIKLIDAAAEAGADMVKFQTFKSTNLASARAVKASYQKVTTDKSENQLDMLRRLELTNDDHLKLVEHCQRRGITFLSTAGEVESLRFLAETLNLPTIKLGSGELTNAPLLLAAARTEARLILSTGMGTISEIEMALGILAFGMTYTDDLNAGREAFSDALLQNGIWDRLREKVSLLQCTTEYPSAVEDTNLRVMDTLHSAFGLEIGYSDHTEGNAISFAAVALGATIIEKHITLDRTMEGPDHAASVEPDTFADLVCGIRQVEKALGSGIKRPSPRELENRKVVRRSLVAARLIKGGTVLSAGDLTVKRPGEGISAVDLWDIVGRRAVRDLVQDETLRAEDLS